MKIRWFRDLPDRKIKGLVIHYGYACNVSYKCDCAQKCKYRYSRKSFARYYTSAVMEIRRFFEYKLKIKLPYLLFIGHTNRDLSGTAKCPFNKSRCYTCWVCKYSYGDRGCSNEDYRKSDWKTANDFEDPDWHQQGRCKFFEKTEWADKYDKETGEDIF